MMDEGRFSRLEIRVDEIKDDISEMKAEQRVLTHSIENLKLTVKDQNETMKAHVAGDAKIINQIKPVIEEFKFAQEQKRRRIAQFKEWTLKLGVPATIIGIIAASVKIWTSF